MDDIDLKIAIMEDHKLEIIRDLKLSIREECKLKEEERTLKREEDLKIKEEERTLKREERKLEIKRILPCINNYVNYLSGQIINKKESPYRLTQADFEKCDTILKDPNYIKLLNGVNYKTGRTIKIKGDVYNIVLKEFNIRGNIPPEDIITINREEYLEKSKAIISEIAEYNSKYKHIIDKYNDAMKIKILACEKYNRDCLEAIEQIKKLTTWDSYIEHHGLRYGIPEIHENIHRKDDCMGVFEYSDIQICDCFACNHHGCCSNPIKQIFKCSVCGVPKDEKITYHM
jgi:hypothetical protein